LSREHARETNKEEIRGLFVLGLLAVLASVRVQYSTMIVNIGQDSYDMILFFDITIFTWSLYAFFMVFGLSEDMIGKTIASVCYESAKGFLYFNFLALFVLSFILAYSAYPTRLPWVLGLLTLFGIFVLIRKLRKREKKPFKFDLKKAVWSSLSPFLMIVLFLAFTMILLDVNEQVVLPALVVGCVTIVAWFIVKLKTKEQNQTKL